MKYDYLIVGAGLFGATFARLAKDAGKKCLVVEKRNHIAGNAYTENIEGIEVHKYGAHIFHSSDETVWQFVNRFAKFNNFINAPLARYKEELYNLPFNMNTFHAMWGVKTPEEAIQKIEEQKREAGIVNPQNLEELAISLVGTDIYTKLIKGYTEKQWGRDCKDLPVFIIKRIPVRLIYDNNYFKDRYQGIPEEGYTKLVERMLEGSEVRLGTDYLENKSRLDALAEKVIYTGPIDAYFGYRLGALEYRSLRFETEVFNQTNFQGNAVINYTEREVPYTRVIEHKHFNFGTQLKTVVTREFPENWEIGREAYYSINDEKNLKLYERYKNLAELDEKVVFGGRLGMYKYFDMDKVIACAMKIFCKEEEVIRILAR